MERSEEIQRIVERFTKATVAGDHEAALGRLSEHAGTLIIGNDPGEWWHGDEARAIWQRQLEEIGGFPVVTYEVEAHACRGTASAAWTPIETRVPAADRNRESYHRNCLTHASREKDFDIRVPGAIPRRTHEGRSRRSKEEPMSANIK